MGKDGFMTPKAIANRIKAKGLQKLRWYCQLCQKQCRDENGFKCHQTSDSHRRQMELFGMNPDKVVDSYSEEFEKSFLEHLKRAHPFSRVLAKNVYNEFINDRHHIHMNSTKWLTLTDFVKHLGKEGLCKVDETEKGWWVTLIMKDPMEEIDEEKRLKRTAAEREEEDRHMAEIRAQVERARKAARTDDVQHTEGGELVKTDDAPLVLSLAPAAAAAAAAAEDQDGEAAGPSGRPAGLPPRAPRAAAPLQRVAPAAPVFAADDDDTGPSSTAAAAAANKAKTSKLDELMRKDLEAKAKQTSLKSTAANGAGSGGGSGRDSPWVAPGIVVKVMSKELQEHGLYKKKGVVERVIDKYVGEIAMLDSGDVVRVDQAQLETVIPQPGGTVLILRGPHKGTKAGLREIDTAKFQARVRLSEGAQKGTDLWLDYEDISKLSSSS